MNKPSVGIVGMGVVGKGILKLFQWATGYDIYDGQYMDNKDAVNNADICFVCVPTPSLDDGACDTSIVEEVIGWLEADVIVIKSTVAVGTTDRLVEETGKRICFSPEYQGATQHSHPANEFVILGGDSDTTMVVAQAYQYAFDAYLQIKQTDAKTAELVKYVENTWLATKVVFCNEMARIGRAMGVDYNELRELFLLDSRVNPSHTFVYYDQPYYDSHCLNKDIPALVRCAKDNGYDTPFVRSVIRANAGFKMEDFNG